MVLGMETALLVLFLSLANAKVINLAKVPVSDWSDGSDWIGEEVRWSLEKGKEKGILGIRLNIWALINCGARVIGWNPREFEEDAECARSRAGKAITSHIGSIGSCVR